MTSQSKLAADKDPQVGWWWDGGHSEFSITGDATSFKKQT